MPQNFLACDREQELLLPPSLREWLPRDHLAWFVIDAVGQFDLAAFYAAYRADGHGRAAGPLGGGGGEVGGSGRCCVQERACSWRIIVYAPWYFPCGCSSVW